MIIRNRLRTVAPKKAIALNLIIYKISCKQKSGRRVERHIWI